jgi:hypothetical protein
MTARPPATHQHPAQYPDRPNWRKRILGVLLIAREATALLRDRRGGDAQASRRDRTASPGWNTQYKLTSQPTPNDFGVNSRGSLRFHQRARTRARVGRRQSYGNLPK